MQQATVNLFADMKAQPASIQPGLVPATASTDTAPPTSAFTYPANGGTVPAGAVIPIQGTATDTGGGVVGGVEVSVDGGTKWFNATGRTNWQYDWVTPATGTATIKSRAVDDIGNIQGTPTEMTVTIVTGCPSCSLWDNDSGPGHPIPARLPGQYGRLEIQGDHGRNHHRHPLLQGPPEHRDAHRKPMDHHGQLLASAPFTNETASGWQQVNFPAPVNIAANTTYVASYPQHIRVLFSDKALLHHAIHKRSTHSRSQTARKAETAYTRTARQTPSQPAVTKPVTTGSMSFSRPRTASGTTQRSRPSNPSPTPGPSRPA